jgi:hypothetical protein
LELILTGQQSALGQEMDLFFGFFLRCLVGQFSVQQFTNKQTMKKSLIGLSLLVVAGCTTSQQTTAYTTIATVEQTATVAVDGYYSLVLKGIVTTNSIPIVSKAFNDLQAAGTLAAAASQAGANALATSNLVVEASSLGALIQTLESK